MNRITPPRRRRPRSPGRPPTGAEDDVRAALLDAASRLFLKRGFERVTARQIAAAAGTTPAMIHYYFTSKLGLFRAMLERVIAPVREALAGALADPEAPPLEPARLIGMQMRTVAGHGWIPTLIVNEVLAERGRFRSAFVRDIASRQVPMIVELLERGRRSGRFRPDLDVRLAALSLISLCMFPFIAHAVVAPVFDLDLEGADLEGLIAHTSVLFVRAIENSSPEAHS